MARGSAVAQTEAAEALPPVKVQLCCLATTPIKNFSLLFAFCVASFEHSHIVRCLERHYGSLSRDALVTLMSASYWC